MRAFSTRHGKKKKGGKGKKMEKKGKRWHIPSKCYHVISLLPKGLCVTSEKLTITINQSNHYEKQIRRQWWQFQQRITIFFPTHTELSQYILKHTLDNSMWLLFKVKLLSKAFLIPKEDFEWNNKCPRGIHCCNTSLMNASSLRNFESSWTIFGSSREVYVLQRSTYILLHPERVH